MSRAQKRAMRHFWEPGPEPNERTFQRPLRIGDAEQAEAIRRMNGSELYCPRCFHLPDRGKAHHRQRCLRCGRAWYTHGAAAALSSADQRM